MTRGLKTRCSGKWTEAKFKGWVVSLLRAGTMRWAPRYDVIKAAFVKKGLNPKTGKPCKLHRCADCQGLFAQGDMKADHLEPVVDPKKGFVDWNTYIARLFVEVDKMQALCEDCHHALTQKQNIERRQIKNGTYIPDQHPL